MPELSASELHNPLLQADPCLIAGMSQILRMAHHQEDLSPLWEGAMARASQEPPSPAAMMDLAQILFCKGQTDPGLRLQQMAVGLQRNYCVTHGDGSGLRVLAFVASGDLMTNTPLDFLLHGSHCQLWLRYVDADTPDLADLPAHDVAFVAIGESAATLPILQRLKVLLRDWQGPILNHDPDTIMSLTRDGVSERFAAQPSILAPRARRMSRDALSNAAAELVFPVILRPVGTHAGNGMHLVNDAQMLVECLAAETGDSFYVTPFIDYAGADGLFHKQRVVLIEGKPYPSHLAISSHWMVHYLNAGMNESAAKRAVEEAWMRDFDQDFAARHADAFAALYREIGLDYFGIDCAETSDGRLLLFELDVAMVVHDMDEDEIYRYKKPAMRRLFDAFLEMLARKSHGAAASGFSSRGNG